MGRSRQAKSGTDWIELIVRLTPRHSLETNQTRDSTLLLTLTPGTTDALTIHQLMTLRVDDPGTMTFPTWLPASDNQFNPSSAPILIYNSLKKWIKINLSTVKNKLLNLGGSKCWPQQGLTREYLIQNALSYTLRKQGWSQFSGYNTRTCCLKRYPKYTPAETSKVDSKLHMQQQLPHHLS